MWIIRLFLHFIHMKIKVLIAGVAIAFMLAFMSFAPNTRDFEVSKNLEIFADVFNIVNKSFIEKIDPKEVIENGIVSMLQSLDPYTDYIAEESVEDYKFITSGKYGGIGASIRKVDDYVYISEPYKGFSADKAGLKAGDKIIEIDGVSCKNKEVDFVINLLKGNPKSKLKLVYQRYGETSNKTVEFEREEIHVDNVPYHEVLDNNIGYILLTNFSEQAGVNVREAVKELKKKAPLNGIIIDLRGNGGGLLNEAVEVLNVFLPKGKDIVYTKSRLRKNNFNYRTLDMPIDEEIPLAILIDKGTASASEIVSGSIQDYDRGVIIGERSFGKGLVQATENIAYNGKLKFTTAKYFLHSGRCVQAIDYSHRYTDGVLENMPDSLRKAFKTNNGRKVLDGGGVDPDLTFEGRKYTNVLFALVQSDYIFEFANEYVRNHPEKPVLKGFSISDSDYNEFENFIKDKKLEYKTESEFWLDSLETVAKKENYNSLLKNDLELLKDKIKHDKKQDIQKNKTEIKQELEQEIIARYYYQEGRIDLIVRKDSEVKSAIDLLMNKSEYAKILNQK